jgi:hypothetical protein
VVKEVGYVLEGAGLERDDFFSNHPPAVAFCLSVILSENPCPLFWIHALGLSCDDVEFEVFLDRRDLAFELDNAFRLALAPGGIVSQNTGQSGASGVIDDVEPTAV